MHQVGFIYKILTRVMYVKYQRSELRPAMLMNTHTCYGIRHLMELYTHTTISYFLEKGRRITLIRKVAKYISSYTASYPRRQEVSLRCSFKFHLKLPHRLAASWWTLIVVVRHLFARDFLTKFSYLSTKDIKIKYINKIQQDATDTGINYCKITLHVSGVYRTHHQEYIKL